MKNDLTINILLPVLNEERRIGRGITGVCAYMEAHFPGRYVIHVMDNGSTDRTEKITKQIIEEGRNKNVRYVKCSGRGVGLAFREGVRANRCDIVGYMDIDLSTDLNHIADVMELFSSGDVQMVNASRLAKNSRTVGRKWYRNISSFGLTMLLKLCFGMRASDSVCGFKFFEKDAAEWLVRKTPEEDGWFFIVECLLRAEKSGMNVIELPVSWKDDWNSNLKTGKLIRYYLEHIFTMWKRKNEMKEPYQRNDQ